MRCSSVPWANNAGAARPGQFATLTDDDWHTDIETKLLSQIRCTRAALPHLRQSGAPERPDVLPISWSRTPLPQPRAPLA